MDADDPRSRVERRRLALAEAAARQQQRDQDLQQRRARAQRYRADARAAWRQQELLWRDTARRRGSAATAAFWDPYLGMAGADDAATVKDTVLRALLGAVLDTGRTTKGNVQLLDPLAGGLRITTYHNHSRPFLQYFDVITDQAASCGHAMAQGRPVAVDDVTRDPIFVGTESMQMLLDDGSRAVLSIPILKPTGDIIGVVSAHYPKPGRIPKAQRQLLCALTRRAGRLLLSQDRQQRWTPAW